jgi:hypothetical protein
VLHVSIETKTQTSNRRKALTSRFVSLVAALGISALGMACSESSTDPGPTLTPNPTTPSSLITLESPLGGQSYKLGQVMQIKWKAKADPVDKVDAVDILYSVDNGVSWGWLNESSIFDTSAVWGNYPWKVDSVLIDGKNTSPVSATVKIKVEQYSTSDPDKIAISNTFTVTAN